MWYNGIVKKVGTGHHGRNLMVAFLMQKNMNELKLKINLSIYHKFVYNAHIELTI